jgi:DNA-binding transcriptional LysR family regulator
VESLSLTHLENFLDIIDRQSIQAAARARGRSRATCGRMLRELEAAFDGTSLIQRAPGQRNIVLTPAGNELARRARNLLRHWTRWQVGTRDALLSARRGIRVGVLVGAFDLLADVLGFMRGRSPTRALQVIEYTDDDLLGGVIEGEVDIGFGTLNPAGVPRALEFHPIGSLPWVVIMPESLAETLREGVRLVDLDGRPLVVPRAGPARETLEQQFAEHEGRPLTFHPVFEAGSSPRVVEAVARGYGVAVVSRFRALFLQQGVVVRDLLDGPEALMAGAFTRRGAPVPAPAKRLYEAAKRHFHELSQAERGSLAT